MKLVKKVMVKNRLGLHTRPATVIVQMLQNCRSEVTFTCRKETINARSLLSILMLAARQNSKITIAVDGLEGEVQKTMDALVEAFENRFGE